MSKITKEFNNGDILNAQDLNNIITEHNNLESSLSNLITKEEFSYIETMTGNSLSKGSLATINGETLENGGNIYLDLSLYKIVEELPEENILDNKIYMVPKVNGKNETEFTEYVWTGTTWNQFGVYKTTIDLSGYIKTVDADNKYLPKSGSTSGSSSSSGGASISISQQGSFNNFGDNGQAFNAVRDVSKNTNYLDDKTGSKYKINAASFGVKLDGTTAFSHKKYDTFNSSTGAYTGARNTAVLVFSGNSGLLYAKNTGSAADVTTEMYKYVGVIDSPDEKQKVYSASEVDEIVRGLTEQINELKQRLDNLTNTND